MAILVVGALVIAGLIPMPAAVATGDLRTDGFGLAPVAAITEHVLVISIDGLRPDAIERFGATSIWQLMQDGRYSLHAQTILPSNTIPGHTSMVTGVEPSVHGVTWNDRASVLSAVVLLSDRRRQVPTMFEFAREAGYSSAAILAKSQMRQLDAPGSLDHLAAPFLPIAHFKREWGVSRVVTEVERYLITDRARPNLLFVHFAEPDLTGHEHGWMSDEYGAAVREADRGLGRVLSAADTAFGSGGYTVILTSDHGGLGDGHGGSDPREVSIPWITAGRGVEPGGALEMPIRVTDIAATALWLLGVPVPAAWTGTPVETAYTLTGRRNSESRKLAASLAFPRRVCPTARWASPPASPTCLRK